MKLGILSDTHGRLSSQLYEIFKELRKAERYSESVEILLPEGEYTLVISWGEDAGILAKGKISCRSSVSVF
ncbi:hypothetical protein B5M50_01455 [candidate division KSB1 bacterium 4484_219]|nr:MAG: hypothetical protein B5M50_01455 [candidate division KSB1 bacterium 4484_219]